MGPLCLAHPALALALPKTIQPKALTSIAEVG